MSMTAARRPAKPPFARLDFAEPLVELARRPDGSLVLASGHALGDYPRSLGDMLVHQAQVNGERVFLGERDPSGGWRRITFRQTLEEVRRLAQAVLNAGCDRERTVAILSGNGIDHALLALAAMHVGVPAAPISVAYSLMSQDHAKLLHCVRQVTPGVLYVDNGAPYARALAALQGAGLLEDVTVVIGANPPAGIDCVAFERFAAATPTPAVDAAFAALTPDTIAKVLFTSGSTGLPKGVINTQRMMCSNQQALSQVYRFVGKQRPPVLLDWLPWNHTFGGNHDFNMMLFHGGTMYIDGGKPAPGLIDQTIANLREVSPTIYLNVPRGYDMLLPALERDAALRKSFFRDLELIFYAAAALPQNLWDRLEDLSIAERGDRITMGSAWGSTETAPAATAVHWIIEQPGAIGLPIPGTEILLTPNGNKHELRVRGPNVTPGYWRSPELTRTAFDAEGFYRIGDAGKLFDPQDAAKGVVFDGRVAEDFKLSSGTWVHAGALRVKAISAAAPVIMDCVVAGHDREAIGLLVFPNAAACLSLCPGLPADTPLPALASRPEVRAALEKGLRAHNKENTASSVRIARVLMLDSMPSIDANEITDKGYINQRAVLEARAAAVERLFAARPDTAVIVL
ncbi:MAG: feruloyl-CoA synthase [Reyranellaceae bacterium]